MSKRYARHQKVLMLESPSALEEERRSLLHQLSQLTDFRPGSITATRGRYGNPRCHCHRPGEAGRASTLRLTIKAGDKTVTESFSAPAARLFVATQAQAFRAHAAGLVMA